MAVVIQAVKNKSMLEDLSWPNRKGNVETQGSMNFKVWRKKIQTL